MAGRALQIAAVRIPRASGLKALPGRGPFIVPPKVQKVIAKLGDFRARMEWHTHDQPEVQSVVEHCHVPGHRDRQLLSIIHPEKLRRILGLELAPIGD